MSLSQHADNANRVISIVINWEFQTPTNKIETTTKIQHNTSECAEYAKMSGILKALQKL